MFISRAIAFNKSRSKGKAVEDPPEAGVPLTSLRGSVSY